VNGWPQGTRSNGVGVGRKTGIGAGEAVRQGPFFPVDRLLRHLAPASRLRTEKMTIRIHSVPLRTAKSQRSLLALLYSRQPWLSNAGLIETTVGAPQEHRSWGKRHPGCRYRTSGAN